MYEMQTARARRVGTYRGKPLYRIPVVVCLNDSHTMRTKGRAWYEVLAHRADDAANLIRAEWAHRPETEVIAFGPSGGRARRFIGWESAVGHMFSVSTGQQLYLPLSHQQDDLLLEQ